MVLDVANSLLAQEIVDLSKAVAVEYLSTQILLDVVLYTFISALALLIFKEVSGLYSISRYGGLKHFRNAFLFFGIGNVAALLVGLLLALMKYSTDVVILFLALLCAFLIVAAGISLWIARASLLYAILWRSIDNISTKKRFKYFSFAVLMLFIAMDELIYEMLLDYYHYAIIYKAMVFTLILLMIRHNQRSSGRIGRITHPYYLGLIMLFTLSFLGSIIYLPFMDYLVAETILNALTTLVYLVIFAGIRKWARILTI